MALGTDHARRLALRERLKAVRLTCPLFDTRRWVEGEQLSTYICRASVAGKTVVSCLPVVKAGSAESACDRPEDDGNSPYNAHTLERCWGGQRVSCHTPLS